MSWDPKNPNDMPRVVKLDSLYKDAFGLPRSEALKQGICVCCKKPARERCPTKASRREWQMSALCEECFDELFDNGE